MPGPTSPQIVLSEPERQELIMLIRAHKTPQHISFRAHIILRLADGHNTRDVADHLRTTRVSVRRWRYHWLKRQDCAVFERL